MQTFPLLIDKLQSVITTITACKLCVMYNNHYKCIFVTYRASLSLLIIYVA